VKNCSLLLFEDANLEVDTGLNDGEVLGGDVERAGP
jgi:hypothetical protein